jgi:hypothetical protein
VIKKINYSAHDGPPSTVELLEKMDEMIDVINNIVNQNKIASKMIKEQIEIAQGKWKP